MSVAMEFVIKSERPNTCKSKDAEDLLGTEGRCNPSENWPGTNRNVTYSDNIFQVELACFSPTIVFCWISLTGFLTDNQSFIYFLPWQKVGQIMSAAIMHRSI